jgi:DNA-binding Xre family transcriptional regulator
MECNILLVDIILYLSYNSTNGTINGVFILELKIDELIKQQGITWAELSRRSGISKGVLSQIKNGQKRTLNPDYERELALALNVTVAELYTEKVNW